MGNKLRGLFKIISPGSVLRLFISSKRQTIARVVFFIIYFWFGIIKVAGLSPDTSMVQELFNKTLAGVIDFNTFYLIFAWLEVAIGVMFLIPRLTKITLIVFYLHMLTTFLPLFLIPQGTWQQIMVPTMGGQYIIKNLALIALSTVLL